MFVSGDPLRAPGPHGEQLRDSSFLLWFNAHADPGKAKLPANQWVGSGEVVLSTDSGHPVGEAVRRPARSSTSSPAASRPSAMVSPASP